MKGLYETLYPASTIRPSVGWSVCLSFSLILLLLFLVADTQLYKMLCLFVGLFVGPSVGLSHPSVRQLVCEHESKLEKLCVLQAL